MMLLDLAGWRFRLDCSPPWLAEAVAARFGAFRAHFAAPIDFTVTVKAGEDALPGRAGGSASLLCAKLAGQGREYILDSAELCGKIDTVDQHASLTLKIGDPLAETEYFLRVACALFAYLEGGLLVHAAALLDREQAHVFVGPSGSGKSTIVSLSRDHVALSDDLVLLRRGSSGWSAHGTPFWNLTAVDRTGQTASGPTAAFYRLVKDDRTPVVRDMPLAAAVSELAASCPVVNGLPSELPGLLARCHELAISVPVRELHFRKDPGFWAAIDESAAGHGVTGRAIG